MKFHTGTAVPGESLWPGWDEKETGKLSLVLEGFLASIWWKQIYTRSLLSPNFNFTFLL